MRENVEAIYKSLLLDECPDGRKAFPFWKKEDYGLRHDKESSLPDHVATSWIVLREILVLAEEVINEYQ